LKIVAVLVFALITVLLATISTCLTVKNRQTSEEKPMEISNKPNDTANGDTSSAKNEPETGSIKAAESGGNPLEGNSKSTDQAVLNGTPVETPSEQSTSQASGNDTASVSAPPPDGRVYSGGEEPYAYIPTYSPKAERLPIIPLPGE
jgi:hypothetical protein